LTNKGLALSKLGKQKEALKVYEKALEIKPNSYDILYNYACACSLMKNREQALYYLKHSIEITSLVKERAKSDKDFQDLWEDSDFKKIVS
jgi:tetratricopeptide (TPR) repeat protein